jgi:hypothetical protein
MQGHTGNEKQLFGAVTSWRIMEAYAIPLLYGGLALAALAWVWLIVRAFREKVWWGLASLSLPPLALVFALRHAQKAIGPLVAFVLGGLVMAAPVSYSLVGPAGLHDKLREGSNLWSLTESALQSDAAHEWMEGRAFYMQLGGLATAAVAWIWLLVRAFRQHRRWGLSSLVVPPVGLIFAGRHPRRGAAPLILFLLSLLVAAMPALYTLYVPLDLGPLDKIVDGQRHLTLTGWDRKDYSILKLKPDVVVLQMANPDVTDESIESLQVMKALQELDLSGTQVTDTGLKVLKDLPALSKLRLARTKITDEGFHSTLFAKDSLMQLDLTGTQVGRETVQAWRNAKSGRKAMQ